MPLCGRMLRECVIWRAMCTALGLTAASSRRVHTSTTTSPASMVEVATTPRPVCGSMASLHLGLVMLCWSIQAEKASVTAPSEAGVDPRTHTIVNTCLYCWSSGYRGVIRLRCEGASSKDVHRVASSYAVQCRDLLRLSKKLRRSKHLASFGCVRVPLAMPSTCRIMAEDRILTCMLAADAHTRSQQSWILLYTTKRPAALLTLLHDRERKNRSTVRLRQEAKGRS